MEEKKWYLTLNYQETKGIIRENLESMSRSFIAIGYYLRMIKETSGYKEDGYKDIWEFAEDQYGIKRSTASRWMDMNARFSEGGNSPVLAEEFKEYQKSQLQEMLYLPEEKLEEVAPDMTVKEIREIRKPEKEKELQRPDEHQREYLNLFAKYFINVKQEWMLGDFQNRVMNVAKSPEEIKSHLGIDRRTWYFSVNGKSAHINLFDDYVQVWDEENNWLGDFEWFHLAASIQSMWNEVAIENAQKKVEQERTGYSKQCLDCNLNKNGQAGILECHPENGEHKCITGNVCDVAQDSEPKFDKSSCPPEQSSCPRTEWGTEPEQQHEGSLECAECWRDYMERQKALKKLEDREASEECATSHIEEDISEDIALINRLVLEYCENYCNLTELIEICKGNDKNAVRARKVQEMLAPCGESGGGEWGFSYTFYGYSRGLKFEQEGQEAALSYIQFVKVIEEFYGPWEEEKKTMDAKGAEEYEDDTTREDAVIETMGVEVETDPEEMEELSDLEIAQSELEKARTLLSDMLECYPDSDRIVRKQKVIVEALTGFIDGLDAVTNPPEPPEQPELPLLKNNDQRKEWLRNYKEWGLWYEDKNIGVKYYRYIFVDGTQLIAEEYPSSYYDYTSYLHLVGGPSERTLNQHGSYRYPYHEKYTRYPDNESEIVEFLKHIQKGGKKSC